MTCQLQLGAAAEVLMIGAFPLAYLHRVGVVLTRRRKQNEAV